MPNDDPCGIRIVVVGPCAAGKTTLVNNLRPKGYNIRSCGQEHSYVHDFWRRNCHSELLVFLDAEALTLLRRQNRAEWPPALLERQRQRLAHARKHCDLYLQTDRLTCAEVAQMVEQFLRERGIVPCLDSSLADKNT